MSDDKAWEAHKRMCEIMTQKSIPEWQKEVYTLAKTKGWYDNPDLNAHCEMTCLAVAASLTLGNQTETVRNGQFCDAVIEILPSNGASLTPDQHVKIARLWLIASEVFEAIECVVNNEADLHTSVDGNKPEGFGIELADVAIRLLDFCEAYKIPLDSYMNLKHAYNVTRPIRHGGKKV